MRPNVVIVGVGELARAADEGLIVPLHGVTPALQLTGGFESAGVLNLLRVRHLLIDLESSIQRSPYAAQL